MSGVKAKAAVRRYYVLPCCLLILNLVNSVVSYKAGVIADGLVRTLVVIALVLFGSSLVAYAVSPSIEWVMNDLQRRSRRASGGLGEALFLIGLGVAVFWLYYEVHTGGGVEAILPRAFWNARHHG